MPFFRFMTGATRYRIEAADREEAIRIAFEALLPTDDMKAVILNTLYSEEDAKNFVGETTPSSEEPPEEEKETDEGG